MTKGSFSATWLGDGDPLQQVIEVGGQRFVKGEAVTVDADNPMAAKIRGNPMFASDKEDAEPVESLEPAPPNLEDGTELGAAKAEAARLGIKLQGNPSLDTVRGRIAAHKG